MGRKRFVAPPPRAPVSSRKENADCDDGARDSAISMVYSAPSHRSTQQARAAHCDGSCDGLVFPDMLLRALRCLRVQREESTYPLSILF